MSTCTPVYTVQITTPTTSHRILQNTFSPNKQNQTSTLLLGTSVSFLTTSNFSYNTTLHNRKSQILINRLMLGHTNFTNAPSSLKDPYPTHATIITSQTLNTSSRYKEHFLLIQLAHTMPLLTQQSITSKNYKNYKLQLITTKF